MTQCEIKESNLKAIDIANSLSELCTKLHYFAYDKLKEFEVRFSELTPCVLHMPLTLKEVMPSFCTLKLHSCVPLSHTSLKRLPLCFTVIFKCL